jgi:hypothetical protein
MRWREIERERKKERAREREGGLGERASRDRGNFD